VATLTLQTSLGVSNNGQQVAILARKNAQVRPRDKVVEALVSTDAIKSQRRTVPSLDTSRFGPDDNEEDTALVVEPGAKWMPSAQR